MKILGLVDIHSKVDRLEDIAAYAEDVDLVLIAGDITNFGVADKAEEVLSPLTAVSKKLYAVTGNCDYKEVDDYLEENDLHLEGKPRELDSCVIVGIGGSLPCPSTTPHEHSEEEFAQLLDAQCDSINGEKPILSVIHQPPFQTNVDKSLLAGHVGSQSVRAFIERKSPALCFSGHIHESRGVDTLGETVLVNPGPFLKGYFFLGELNGKTVDIELKQL